MIYAILVAVLWVPAIKASEAIPGFVPPATPAMLCMNNICREIAIGDYEFLNSVHLDTITARPSEAMRSPSLLNPLLPGSDPRSLSDRVTGTPSTRPSLSERAASEFDRFGSNRPMTYDTVNPFGSVGSFQTRDHIGLLENPLYISMGGTVIALGASLLIVLFNLRRMATTTKGFSVQLMAIAQKTDELMHLNEGLKAPRLVVESIELRALSQTPTRNSAQKTESNVLDFELIITLRNFGGSPALKGVLTYFQSTRRAERRTEIPVLPGIRQDFSLGSNEQVAFLNRIQLSRRALATLVNDLSEGMMELLEGTIQFETLTGATVSSQFSFEIEPAFITALLKGDRNFASAGSSYFLRLNHEAALTQGFKHQSAAAAMRAVLQSE